MLSVCFGCGGSKGSGTSTKPPSELLKRAFVSNSFLSTVQIIDAKTDHFNGFSQIILGAAGSPSILQMSPDRKLVLAFDSTTFQIIGVDVAQEVASGAIQLANWTESFVMAPDNNTIYAAVRNATTNQTVPGAVQVGDSSKGQVVRTVPIAKAHWLVLGHNGGKLLVFSDDSDVVSVVDTSTFAVTQVAGFDRPVWAVFSSDDSKAYILNCGAECGGTAASVTVLDLGTNTPGTSTPVSAATYAMLDGTNLYVAGSDSSGGKLDIVNTGNLTVSKSGIPITDGYHWRMLLTGGNLYVGARNCSNTGNGCLAIVNVSGGTSTLADARGDVTGMEPIPGRDVVYVCQGGELVIYDNKTAKPQSTQIDIVGKAYDVRYVD